MATSMAQATPAAPAKSADRHDDGSALLILAGLAAAGGAGFLLWKRRSQTAPTPTPTPQPSPGTVCHIRQRQPTDVAPDPFGGNPHPELGVPYWVIDSGGSIVPAHQYVPYGQVVHIVPGSAINVPSPHWFGRDVTVYPWPDAQGAFLSVEDVNCQ